MMGERCKKSRRMRVCHDRSFLLGAGRLLEQQPVGAGLPANVARSGAAFAAKAAPTGAPPGAEPVASPLLRGSTLGWLQCWRSNWMRWRSSNATGSNACTLALAANDAPKRVWLGALIDPLAGLLRFGAQTGRLLECRNSLHCGPRHARSGQATRVPTCRKPRIPNAVSPPVKS